VSETRAAAILVIEDDAPLAETLREILEGEGYGVRVAETAAAAREAIDAERPDLVLMDLVLPDADGLILCADIKSKAAVPVLVVSGTVRKRDSVLALKLGADDFISKPFDVDELIQRVAAALRRAATAESAGAGPAPGIARLSRGGSAGARGSRAQAEHDRDPVSVLGPLRLERTHKRVTLDGHEVELTPTEYRLLSAFLVRPNEVLSRRELAQLVWGYEDASIGRSIDVHVHRLRTKLQHAQEANGRPAPSVISVRGFGYKLLGDAAATAAAA
jgi:two-component system response regulator MprA